MHKQNKKTYTNCCGEGQYYSAEMLREEKYLEFVFEGRESSRVSDISGEVVPDVRTKRKERVMKAKSFAFEVSEFEYVRV